MTTTGILALLGAAALITTSATGCSDSAGGDGRGSFVRIDGTSQLRFDPATVTVHTGTVIVRFHDVSSYPHDIRVPKLGVTSRTVTGDPGEVTTTLTLHFPHPGVYPFECTYHDSAGMRGTFVVKP